MFLTGISLVSVLFTGLCQELHSTGEGVDGESPLQAGVSFTGDMAHSLAGGLKRGSATLGLVSLRVSLNAGASWPEGI
jgi:hypothetical protein